MNPDLQEFISTTRSIINRIDDNANVVWSGFSNGHELKNTIRKDLDELEKGNMEFLIKVYGHYLPTGTFQEIYIDENWDENPWDTYARIDELYARIKPKENKTSFFNKLKTWWNEN